MCSLLYPDSRVCIVYVHPIWGTHTYGGLFLLYFLFVCVCVCVEQRRPLNMFLMGKSGLQDPEKSAWQGQKKDKE